MPSYCHLAYSRVRLIELWIGPCYSTRGTYHIPGITRVTRYHTPYREYVHTHWLPEPGREGGGEDKRR